MKNQNNWRNTSLKDWDKPIADNIPDGSESFVEKIFKQWEMMINCLVFYLKLWQC